MAVGYFCAACQEGIGVVVHPVAGSARLERPPGDGLGIRCYVGFQSGDLFGGQCLIVDSGVVDFALKAGIVSGVDVASSEYYDAIGAELLRFFRFVG